MTKRWRKIGLFAFLGIAAVLTGLVLYAGQEPRMSDSVSFLHGLEGRRSVTFLDLRSLLGKPVVAPPPTVYITETFLLDQPYETLSEVAKKELKPKAISASGYSNKELATTLYTIRDPATGKNLTISLQKRGGGKTFVYLTQSRRATWLDRGLDWLRGLFRSKPSTR
jgi:hypothetical protein